jgi:hypothetical protein
MNEGLAQHVHTLATRLWYRLVNHPGGPPGVAGPLSEGAPWDATAGYLAGARHPTGRYSPASTNAAA